MSHDGHVSDARSAKAQFTTTHWSTVLAAGKDHSEEAQAALERLCRTYWYPLYVYLRRRGFGPHDAEDQVQGLFAQLLESQSFRSPTPERGRFRSFLLGALNHFTANEWKHAHRLKRGGGATFVPIQTGDAETRFGTEPAHELTPEKIFQRRWAITVLEEGIARLRLECAGKTDFFDELKIYLTGEEGAPSYAEMARRIGKTEDAVKMAVSRMRKQYREMLRTEVAQTVKDPAEVGDELRELLKTFH